MNLGKKKNSRHSFFFFKFTTRCEHAIVGNPTSSCDHPSRPPTLVSSPVPSPLVYLDPQGFPSSILPHLGGPGSVATMGIDPPLLSWPSRFPIATCSPARWHLRPSCSPVTCFCIHLSPFVTASPHEATYQLRCSVHSGLLGIWPSCAGVLAVRLKFSVRPSSL